MPSRLRYVLFGLLFTGVLVGAVLAARQIRPETPALETNPSRSKGPFDAPVQVIEYSDFQCPACGKAQSSLNGLLNEFEGKIHLVYRHFPLSSHTWSGLAHQSAECASRQNHFWAYHDRLYAEQRVWSVSPKPPIETFLQYARDGGLDLDTFSRCLTDAGVSAEIREERAGGQGLGVRSTPSFFVNGELVVGTDPLREKIKKHLA